MAYFIAVKRTSILMGVLWGWVFFHEKNIRERVFGSVLIIIGTILIALK
ncbi:MAG: multidrug DMT transporter [Deltaproteobacteria bacterium]|nr:multidrug DMT transporter [Deltaproteobacteria bacterium]MBI2341883.1 multidrug DMT transporter [Deltaproteobacteria bacterium]MBI2974280.1 multidrug DMT transporter [Deltaproteobacteria bacterium]